jgi:hypothetical protein
MEAIAGGAADQVMDVESSLITIPIRVRMIIKPLLKGRKLRLIDLIRPDINMAKPPTSIDRIVATLRKPENSDVSPKGNPVDSSRLGEDNSARGSP